MAYPIPLGGIIEFNVEGVHDGQQVITSVHYRVEGAAIPDGRAAIIAAWAIIAGAGGWWTKYRSCLSTDVEQLGVYGQYIAPARAAYVQLLPPTGIGVLAGPCMPANVAQVVTRRGEFSGGDSISNLHLPGIPVDAVVNSRITLVHLALMQQFIDASVLIVEPILGTQLIPVALHRVAPSLSIQLVEGYPQDTVRIMRRRTVGVGS